VREQGTNTRPYTLADLVVCWGVERVMAAVFPARQSPVAAGLAGGVAQSAQR